MEKFTFVLLIILLSGNFSQVNAQSSMCGGHIDEAKYLSKVDNIIMALLSPQRNSIRENSNLDHLTFEDFEPLNSGAECDLLMNFFEPFWDDESSAKPVYYTAGGYYFILIVNSRPNIQNIDGGITISGRISGFTTVIALNENINPIALFVL